MEVDIKHVIILLIVLSIIIVFGFMAYRIFIEKLLNEKALQHQLELDHQKMVSQQYINVQENERKRIAEIIHDEIGNKLNVLSLWVNNEETWNNQRSKEIIIQQIPELIESTRTISHSLYPVNLQKFGLILTIQELIANMNESLSVKLINHNYKERPIEIEVQLYRIIQEFLSNVIKHSMATEMIIHLRETEKSLALILSDNGIGFDTKSLQNGMGLNNIDSRIQSINATGKRKSNLGNGSRLIIKCTSV